MPQAGASEAKCRRPVLASNAGPPGGARRGQPPPRVARLGGHGVMVSWAVPGGQAVDGAVDSSEKVGDGDPVVGGQPVDVRQ